MKTYRAGIIGCGWISTAHVNGYRATGRVEVAAAADISPQARETFQTEWGVQQTYRDYREMLDREKLDLVSVCTNSPLHLEMVSEAAARGPRAIICEKPMALSLGEADAMLAACQQADCHLVICHQRRFEARFRKAQELIREGSIGEVTFIRTWCRDIFEDADHVVDLMRYFVEDAKVVRVAGQVEFADPPAVLRFGHLTERAGLGYIEFANGASGLVCTTGLARLEQSYSLSIVGTEGILETSGQNHPAPSWVRVKGRGHSEWQHFEAPNRLLGAPKESLLKRADMPSLEYFWLDSWQGLMESALRTIETGEEGPCSGRSARADIEVLVAMHASARLRKVIEFPVQIMDSPVAIGGAGQAADSIWKLP